MEGQGPGGGWVCRNRGGGWVGTEKVGQGAAGNMEGLCNVNLWKPESASYSSGSVPLSFLPVCNPPNIPVVHIAVTQVQIWSQF